MITITLTEDQARTALALLAANVNDPQIRTRLAVYREAHRPEITDTINKILDDIVKQGIMI